MAEIPDSNALFRALLLLADFEGETNPLPALVGDRVYCGFLPEEWRPEQGIAIEIATRDDGLHPELTIIEPDLQVSVWAGPTQQPEAHAVYRALMSWAHGKNNVDLGAVGYLKASTAVSPSGQDLVDPDTKWVLVLSFFKLIAHAAAA